MAEFAFAAENYDTGEQRGDLISAAPDGVDWGTLDLADAASGRLWIVKVSGIALSIALKAVRPLDEPAMPGDIELGNPEVEDRVIRRHSAQVRVFFDELPASKRNDLTTVGITTLSRGQATAVIRKLVWDRPTGRVKDTGIGEFG